jgi:hypothetical protein
MSRFGLILTLLLALAPAACSDDTTGNDQGTNNDSTVAEQGPTADKGPGPDAPGSDTLVLPDQFVGDFPAKDLSCGLISACADRCSLKCPPGATQILCINKCSTDCKAKGCAAATTAYDKVYACTASKCALDCLGGPTIKCKACIFSKCAAELTACFAQKC